MSRGSKVAFGQARAISQKVKNNKTKISSFIGVGALGKTSALSPLRKGRGQFTALVKSSISSNRKVSPAFQWWSERSVVSFGPQRSRSVCLPCSMQQSILWPELLNKSLIEVFNTPFFEIPILSFRELF